MKFLHSRVTAKFRALCGITKKSTPWPTDPTVERKNSATGEVYWNAWFEHTMMYEDNVALFEAVASSVLMDYKVSYHLTSTSSVTHRRIDHIPEYASKLAASYAF